MPQSIVNQAFPRPLFGKSAAKDLSSAAISTGNFGHYQIGLMYEWLTTLSLLVVFLVPCFFILDLFMMPSSLLPKFAVYRGISTALALVQYFVILRSKPSASSYVHVYFLSFQISTIISLMTSDLGGFNSSYYAGLNLIIMGTNLLMPWKTIHTVINSLLILIMYVLINLISNLSVNPASLLNNLFFLSATALIAASINYVRFKLIKNEFVLLVDLEKSRSDLEGEKQLVDERNRSIKGLLDVSEQGFLSFETDFKVSQEYSKECERIFGRSIVGLDIAQLLYPNPQACAEFKTGLNLYFSGKLKGDVVFDLMDHCLQIANLTVELAFKAVSASRVMIALTDISEELRLQEKINIEDLRKIMILNVVSNRSAFAAFNKEAKALFTELKERQHTPEILLRIIHTFKANAGFLGFSKSSHAAHQLEDFFADRMAIGEKAELAEPIANLAIAYAQEHADIIEALGSKWQIDADSIEIPRDLFGDIERGLHSSSHNSRLIKQLETYKMMPLSELFGRFPQMIKDLALRMGKRIAPLVISVGDTPVLPEDYEGLIDSFAHLIRNIVDHGIELPMDREASGKIAVGTVTINSKVTDNDIVFSFADDGQGLQLKEITQKAKDAGLIDNIHAASPSELLNFIFRDNFSTSPNINDISGRGIGLAAVKHAVKQMDGWIKVRSHQGKGTVFTINIPRIKLLYKELAL